LQRKPIVRNEKKSKSLGCFIILLILAGLIVSAILYGQGLLDEIIHP